MTRYFKPGDYVDVANPEQLQAIWERPVVLPDKISPLPGRGPFKVLHVGGGDPMGGVRLILPRIEGTVSSRYFIVVPTPVNAGEPEDSEL